MRAFALQYAARRAALPPRRRALAHKILLAHAADGGDEGGAQYLRLVPDRVAMQDASAQTALLQFALAGRARAALPASVHCDHLIAAVAAADADVAAAAAGNSEVFGFLRAACLNYGIDFWPPGSGIIHQLVLENYAAPGTLMVGTDSHTPNAGGLGMLAIGVGGADAVDAMAGIPWELRAPKILGVHLTGRLSGWASPKDVILKLAGTLTVKGATNHIIEYFGPGAATLTCTGMATICNMGAEVGATTSIFPYSDAMRRYLIATDRGDIAQEADAAHAAGYLSADDDVEYDRVIELDLSAVEPHVNGPFTPDNAIPLSQLARVVRENGWPDEIKSCLIGSCTNSSYEDMTKAASIAEQALAKGVTSTSAKFLITPGSEQIRATIARDGITQKLSAIGGTILSNACGPCIGQWQRTDTAKDEENVIMSSFNRNFRARNDGNPNTMNFLASPEVVTAMAFAGRLSFNPQTDALVGDSGKEFNLNVPSSEELPRGGFESGRSQYLRSTEQRAVDIPIALDSARLQKLSPFAAWDGRDMERLEILVKVAGKCTTDHISAAGAWLKYKGHLENLARNTLIGARNAWNGRVNSARNALSVKYETIPDVAFAYRKERVAWCIIADENYGEGSAREHAALQPRFLGCRLVIARSFARIHETNLKKQGILPMTFRDPLAYDRIAEGSLISIKRLAEQLASSANTIVAEVQAPDGSVAELALEHTLSDVQKEWFRAGSALNWIRASCAPDVLPQAAAQSVESAA